MKTKIFKKGKLVEVELPLSPYYYYNSNKDIAYQVYVRHCRFQDYEIVVNKIEYLATSTYLIPAGVYLASHINEQLKSDIKNVIHLFFDQAISPYAKFYFMVRMGEMLTDMTAPTGTNPSTKMGSDMSFGDMCIYMFSQTVDGGGDYVEFELISKYPEYQKS